MKPYYEDKDCIIYCGDAFEVSDVIEDKSIDLVLTDPPYNKENVRLYGDFAQISAHILKEGGMYACMCGQSYLPQIMNDINKSLIYRWTIAYLTPGGQSAQLWQRKVNSFWKPVLLYSRDFHNDKWMGDVAKSKVNDNDKRFHKWGQSLSGFRDLVNRLSIEGQTILDPFMGGGTTAVICKEMGRKFIGIEIDSEHCDKTIERLNQSLGEE